MADLACIGRECGRAEAQQQRDKMDSAQQKSYWSRGRTFRRIIAAPNSRRPLMTKRPQP